MRILKQAVSAILAVALLLSSTLVFVLADETLLPTAPFAVSEEEPAEEARIDEDAEDADEEPEIPDEEPETPDEEPETPDEEPEIPAEEPEASEEPITYYFEDDTLAVEAQISPDSVFTVDDAPLDGSAIHITGDTAENDRFAELIEEYAGEVRTVDLSFRDENDDAAEQVTGSTLLTLTIPAEDETAVLKDVELYRCADSGGIERVEDILVDENERTVAFEAGTLGAYAVCYTVDYYYGDQEYHMYGGSTMLLSELLAQLSVSRDAADVERVAFTGEGLLSFERYEDGVDWVIRSLAPFDTTETLTLFFADGETLAITVEDAGAYSESHVLDDFLVNWTLTVGDTVFSDDTVDEDTVIEYKDGMQYSLELQFAERPDLGFETPETDPPAMTFQLPDCFVVPADVRIPLNVSLGRKGVLPDNIVSIVNAVGTDGETHSYLSLRWNWEDTVHWGFFRDSAQAKLKIAVNGVFRDAEPNVLSINGKDVAIRREDLHNASVNKAGYFNKDAGVIDYTVTVVSDGTTSDVTLTDTLGSALIYLTDAEHNYGVVYDAASSINSAGTTPQITQKTGNTFNVVIPAMNDGDTLVFTYSAAVNYDAIAVSGSPTFEETGNTAQIYGDSYTLDNTAVYHETNIDFSDLEKNVIGKHRDSVDGNSCFILTWEIDTNKRAQFPLADTTITDTISENIHSISKYYGDGVTVRCYTESGALAETRALSWDELGVDLENDVTWTYHIPDTDPLYRYKLTYDTIVYMDGVAETIVAGNTAEGKGGIDSDRAVLPPPGNSGIGITKRATNVDSTHVTWEITLTVSGSALNYNRLLLQEHSGATTRKVNGVDTPTWRYNFIPAKWIPGYGDKGGKWYKESLKKVEVIGLEGDENFKVLYGRSPNENNVMDIPTVNFAEFMGTPGNPVLERNFSSEANCSTSRPDYFHLEFFRDADCTVGGLTNPGGESPTRTLTIRLTTEFPETWATEARNYTRTTAKMDSSIFAHTNWIVALAPDSGGVLRERAFDTDKFEPMPPQIYKTVLSGPGPDSTLATADQKKYYILNYPDAEVFPSSTSNTGAMFRDLPVFPCFRYEVVVSGIQYDEPLVIEDSFDTSLLSLVTADDFAGGRYVMTSEGRQYTHGYFMKVFGMDSYGWTPTSGMENYTSSTPYLLAFGYDNKNYYHKAEDYGCTLEKTDTGFRVTINNLLKRPDGSLYPYYGLDYYLIPKDLAALKQIEELARANARAGGEPKVNFTNTASARGTTANANVKIGVTNDFMPLDKTSETYLDLMDGTRVQLNDVQLGNQTVRDTPDGIDSNDIHRYVMKYRVVLNKGGERLNDGNDITAEDEYSSNLSVDFASIRITTEPEEAASRVSYDYSGNIGYFTIPDETKVTIEYEAIILQNSASTVSTTNEVRMLQYKKTVDDTVDHGGAGGSSATNPAILIKKYGSGHMERGLNGARFQLFEYKRDTYTRGDPNTEDDWTPVVLTEPDVHEAIFETHHLIVGDTDYGDGYAEIELSMKEDGATLETGKVYGLREITTPTAVATNGDTIRYQSPHTDDFYCFIFRICRDDETADYQNYLYLPDDTMTVRNTPESTSMHLSKALSGNCTLDDAEKALLTYQVFRKKAPAEGQSAVYMPIMTTEKDPDTGLDVEVIDPRFTNITYAMISESGTELTGLTVDSGATVGEYLLAEYGNDAIMAAHPDWSWRGSYAWADGSTGNFTNTSYTVYDQNGENPHTATGVAFTVTSQEIRDGESKSVELVNTYNRELVTLSAQKKWASPSGAAIAWPSGKTVQFTLGTLDGGVFTALPGKTVTLDNQKDVNGEDAAGRAVFKNLPKYSIVGGSPVPIVYAVRETTGASGYAAVYPAGGADYAAFGAATEVTIRNQVESTAIHAFKAWDKNHIPLGASATLRLYSYTGDDPAAARWVSNVNDVVLDGTVDAGDGASGETAPWRADFTGLPRYDGSGAALRYIVREVGCAPAGYEPVEAYAADGGTITNKPAAAVFTVRKLWTGTAGGAWPSGERITLTLMRQSRAGVTDDTFSAVYVLSADAIVSQDSIVDPYGDSRETGSWAGGTLRVTELPKYDGDGNEWRYYVSETGISSASGADLSGSYTAQYRDKNGYAVSSPYTYSGGSVTNTRSTRELTLSKRVSGNMGDKSASYGFTVTLRNPDSSAYAGTVAYTSSVSGAGTLTLIGGSASVSLTHGESVTLHDLPGSLLYTITEAAADADGYATSYVTNGGASTAGRSVSGELSQNVTVECTNTRQVVIATGVTVQNRLFVAALPILALGMVLLFRRRRYDGEE